MRTDSDTVIALNIVIPVAPKKLKSTRVPSMSLKRDSKVREGQGQKAYKAGRDNI